MRQYFSALCLLLVVPTQAAEPVRIQTLGFNCVGMKHSIRLPERMSQLRKLERIDREEVVRTEVWEGYKAIEIALHFQGLHVGAVTFTNDAERYNLSAARISDAKWSLSPFRVGQPAEVSLRDLGVKGEVTNGLWRFDGESDSLTLKVKGGRFTEVTYECYTG